MPSTTLTSFSPLPPPPPPPPAKATPPEPPVATAPPASPPPPPPPVAAAKPEPTPPAPTPAPVSFRPAAPPPQPLPLAEPESEAPTPGPNLLMAAARSWPLVLIGVVGGIVLGLLYHMQRSPVYQSRAELLVIKNRVELTTPTGAADSRVAYLEDYVATQYRLIQSTEILKLAAKKLTDPKPVGFPADERGQVGYLMSRLAVAREREPGSNALSNTLGLTFRGADPTDSKRCLQVIIEAYEAELGTVYERASGKRLETLDGDIGRLNNDRSRAEAQRLQNERDRNLISQERVESISARITNLRNQEVELTLRTRQIQRDIGLIKTTGPGRQERLAVMDKLGVKVERQFSSAGLDSRTPEDLLFALEQQKVERSRRLGVEHPDMIALDSQMEHLRKLIAKSGLGADGVRSADELERHRLKLENDQLSLVEQVKELGHLIASDEGKAEKMAKHQLDVERFQAEVRQLDEKITEKQRERNQVAATQRSGGYDVKAITPPTEGAQVAPILYQSLMLGGVLGLLLGAGLALGVEMTDRSFRSSAEIRRRLGVPVLGHIPRIRGDAPPTKPSETGLDNVLACFVRPTSPESEAVRGVRTQLYFSIQGRGHQVIQVTSPTPGDGKSTLAANLAISIAQSGKRVVLLDCDFRKPRIHRLFNITNPEVGLASVMGGDAKLSDAVRRCEVENLFVLPCGPRPANPAELLTSPKFQELLAELKGQYDFVIVDSPPVLAVSDPVAVASRVDGVLMVFRMTKNTRPNAERTREQLSAVGARILGVVVNASAERAAGYSGYGYSYQYDYHYTDTYAATDEPLELPKKG